MSKAKGKKAFPHERGIAWAATFLLTVFLALFLLTALFVQALTSAGLHAGTATNDSILDEQVRSIYGYIDLLAEEYGFSPESVKTAVSREDLKKFNLDAAAWWTRVLTEGESGSVPRWYSSEVEQAVTAAMDNEKTKDDPRTVIAELSDKIDRTVFPLRETLLTTGLEFANEKADIPGIVRSVRKLPMLFLALSVLAAGLIMLLMGREPFRSLKYFGTALAAAALVLITAGITLAVMQMKDMLAQASTGLASEFGTLMRTICLEGGGAALILLLAGAACLYLYRNGGIKHRQETAERAI